MRNAFVAVAAVAAGAAALFALAQPASPPPASKQILMPINWGDVRTALSDKRLQRASIRQMTIAPGAPQPSLPVLLPFDQEIATTAIVNMFPQAHSYAASMRLPDLTIEVHGERRAHLLPEDDPLLKIAQAKETARLAGADVPYSLSRTESGYDLTFGRFGAAYLISTECFNPETDPRCTKPDYIRALGAKMGLVGKDAP